MSPDKDSLNYNLNALRRKIARQIQNSIISNKLGFNLLEKITSAIIVYEHDSIND